MWLYCLSSRNYAQISPRAAVLLNPGGLQLTVSHLPHPPVCIASAGRKTIQLEACWLNAIYFFIIDF